MCCDVCLDNDSRLEYWILSIVSFHIVGESSRVVREGWQRKGCTGGGRTRVVWRLPCTAAAAFKLSFQCHSSSVNCISLAQKGRSGNAKAAQEELCGGFLAHLLLLPLNFHFNVSVNCISLVQGGQSCEGGWQPKGCTGGGRTRVVWRLPC